MTIITPYINFYPFECFTVLNWPFNKLSSKSTLTVIIILPLIFSSSILGNPPVSLWLWFNAYLMFDFATFLSKWPVASIEHNSLLVEFSIVALCLFTGVF